MTLRGFMGRHRTMGPLIAVAAVWGLAALTVPLFPDELYYWEWSRRLAAGYFDHPPAIAWLIRAGTLLIGDTPLGIRAFPVLCGLFTAAAVARVAALLAGEQAAPRAILLLAALPIMTGAIVLATPDAPLLATTAWVLYATLRAAREDQPPGTALGWWTAAGILLGLGALSKYIAVLIPIGLAGTILWHRPLRRLLRTPGPWLATLLALVIVAPVVLWNADHDWISFRFQLQHGLGVPLHGSVIGRELELVGGQLLVATPILFAFVCAAVWRTLRGRLDARGVLLAGVTVTIGLVFALSATRQRVEANWLAAAYPPAIALLAGWPLGARGARWLRGGAILAVALTGVLLLHLSTPLLPLPAEPLVVAQARDRAAVAAAVERAAAEQGGNRLHFAANRYQDAASLGYLLPGHPSVFALNISSRSNQYDLWPGFPEEACAGDQLLLVLDAEGDEEEVLGALRPHFAGLVGGQRVERRVRTTNREGEVVGTASLWLLSGWKGTWPARPAQVSLGVTLRREEAPRCRS